MAPARRGLERVSRPFSCSTQKVFYILSAGTAERVGRDGKEVVEAKSVPACQPRPVPGLHTCARVRVCVPTSLFMSTCAKSGPHLGPGNITQPQQAEQEKSRGQELGAPALDLLQRWKYHGSKEKLCGNCHQLERAEPLGLSREHWHERPHAGGRKITALVQSPRQRERPDEPNAEGITHKQMEERSSMDICWPPERTREPRSSHSPQEPPETGRALAAAQCQVHGSWTPRFQS